MNILIPKLVAGVTAGAFLVSSSYAADKEPGVNAPPVEEAPAIKVIGGDDTLGGAGLVGGGIGRAGAGRSFSWSYSGAELEPKGPVTYLGIAADAVSEELAAHLPIDAGIGLVVRNVGSDSPAAKVGIQVNDVLTKIDDQLLVHPKQLQILVRNRQEGDSVNLTYIRKGETKTVKADLIRREVKETRTLYGTHNTDERIRELISAARERIPVPPSAPSAPPLFQKQTVIVGPDGKMTRVGADVDLDRVKRDLERELEKSGVSDEIRKKVAEALKRTQASVKAVEVQARKTAQDAVKAAAEANLTAEEPRKTK